MPRLKPFAYLAAYLILRKNGQVLFLRRFNTGYEDGKYSLIAGHLDGKESVRETAAREAKEETGVDVEVKDMRFVHVQHRLAPDREYIDIYLEAKKWKGEPRNMEPHYCDDVRWFDEKNPPANMTQEVDMVLGLVDKGLYYSELGFSGPAE